MPPLNPLVPSFTLPPHKPKASPTMSATSSSTSWLTVGSDNPAFTRSSMTTAASATSNNSDASNASASPQFKVKDADSEKEACGPCPVYDLIFPTLTVEGALDGHLGPESEVDYDTATDVTPRPTGRAGHGGADHNDTVNRQVKAPYTGWQSSFPPSLGSSCIKGGEQDISHVVPVQQRVSTSNGRASADGHTPLIGRTNFSSPAHEQVGFPPAASIRRARSPSMPILPSIESKQNHSIIRSATSSRLASSSGTDLSAAFNALDVGIGASFYTPPQPASARLSYFDTAPAPKAAPISPSDPAPVRGPFFSSDRTAVHFSDEKLGDLVEKHGGSPFDAQVGLDGHNGIHHAKSLANFADTPVYNGFGLYRNVMVNFLPASMTESSLRAYAEGFGPVHSVAIKQRDQGMGHPQYGFVLFSHPDDARMFMDALRLKKVSCDFAKEDWATEFKSREDKASANLYIVNLPLDFNDSDLEQLLHPARIISHKFLGDHAGNRNGVAMARLESRYQADQAIYRLNGKVRFDGCGEALVIRIADSPDQKQLKRNSGQQLGSKSRSVEAFDPFTRRSSLGGTSTTPYSPSKADHLARQRQYHLAQLAILEGGHPSPRTPNRSLIFGGSTPHHHDDSFAASHGSLDAWRYSHRLPDWTAEYDDEERYIIGPVSPARLTGWHTTLTSGTRSRMLPHQASVGNMRSALSSHYASGPASISTSMFAASLSHARSSPDLACGPKLLFPSRMNKETLQHDRARSAL